MLVNHPELSTDLRSFTGWTALLCLRKNKIGGCTGGRIGIAAGEDLAVDLNITKRGTTASRRDRPQAASPGKFHNHVLSDKSKDFTYMKAAKSAKSCLKPQKDVEKTRLADTALRE